jgi:hypothetical protein
MARMQGTGAHLPCALVLICVKAKQRGGGLFPWQVKGGREGHILGVPSMTSASAKGNSTWARWGEHSLARGEGVGVHQVKGGGSLCGLLTVLCAPLFALHRGWGHTVPLAPWLAQRERAWRGSSKEGVATLQRGCEWTEVMMGGCTYDFGHTLKGGRMGAGEGGEREYEVGQTVECRYICYN